MAIRDRLRRIVFETDTPAGRLYDVLLIVTIALSVGGVMLESVRGVQVAYGSLLHAGGSLSGGNTLSADASCIQGFESGRLCY